MGSVLVHLSLVDRATIPLRGAAKMGITFAEMVAALRTLGAQTADVVREGVSEAHSPTRAPKSVELVVRRLRPPYAEG